MDYRATKEDLFRTLGVWDELIPGRGGVHLIACGGTALTLMGHKESTKDVDLMVPRESEYKRLVTFLKRAGYENCTTDGWKRRDETILYDLYPGKRVYQTELLNSPLTRGGNQKIRVWKKIYLGVLNPVDLIITKMFRGAGVDFGDCLALLRKEKVSLKVLKQRYRDTAKYDVSEDRVIKNLDLLLKRMGGGR